MIEAKQVRYGIRSREILRGVDFRVEKGEFVGLIGPNGSGKSTFLKNVYKVLRPQAGELTLMGDDLLAMSNREMAQRLAVMVQEQEAAFDFTVEEVVMMGRQARKRLLETDSREDRALVGEILARTGLASLREQGFSTLSGGEKQRVLIARALAQQTAVLVLDGRGRALTAAAAVKGMRDFRPDSGIRGVILNRVSPMLYPRLKEAIEGETGVTVYGYLPNLPGCALESRHLGLVTAAEVAGLREKLSALAAQAEKSVDIDGLLALAASAPALDAAAPALPPPVEGRPRIAVARDKAFCFYYADGLELLETLGAELAEFSPLADESLPEGACGLYLGGGYPELFAGALAANAPMREAVRAAVAGGLPTVAECGGFLYLNRLLSDGEGRDWPMAGALPGRAANTGKLGRFGYVTLTAKKDGLLGPAGTRLPAHEFHYWDSDAPGSGFRADKPQSSRGWDCAFHTPTLYAGFPHFHFWAAPSAARNFVAAARRYVQEASL